MEGGRQVRPDLVVTKDGVPVAVLDVKYKRYTQLGYYADVPGSTEPGSGEPGDTAPSGLPCFRPPCFNGAGLG